MALEDDSELVSRFQAGDESALGELIAMHQVPLHRFIYRYVGDISETEDILYHTFVKAWDNRERFRPTAKFQTWLFTIATNLCRDHARRRKRHPADFAAVRLEFGEEFQGHKPQENSGKDPARTTVDNEEATLLRQAIHELPQDLKSALILFSLEGHSQEETARLLDCTPKAVETRVYRAKQRLRKNLKFLR